MKKILFAAMAALAITGCSQNEEVEAPAKKAEISFGTVVKNTSRATAMVTDNFLTFKVLGYNIGDNDFQSSETLGNPLNANGSTYSRKDNTEAWSGDTYYWPSKATEKICFFAYSPESIESYSATTGYPTFGYTIKNVEAQEDLVTAKAMNLLKSENPSEVSLAFSHALTQINFSATLEVDFTYVITKIEIQKVANTGTYSYETDKWSSQSGEATYIYAGKYETYAPTTDQDKGNEFSFSTNDNALMLLPQTFPTASTAKIAITYSVTASNGQETFNGTKEVELKETTAWEEGKNIRYNLTLPTGAEKITFTPSVNTWGSENEKPQTAK